MTIPELVEKLEEKGYKFDILNHYYHCELKGVMIQIFDTVAFSYENGKKEWVDDTIDYKIGIENRKAFNKTSQMPISLPIPCTDSQYEYLLSTLEYAASYRAYLLHSESLEYENDYPFEIANKTAQEYYNKDYGDEI